MNKKAYELMKEWIAKAAQESISEESLNDTTEWTSERSFGNYDDCFSDGQECADAHTALQAREILRQVSEAENE